jgi:hypothetical protein
VSFSDKRVADLVNSKFVAAWTNRGPGFFNTEFWTEKGIASNDYEAYPTKNICTFFLTPKGKVYYYVAGSYAPELFVKILETASSLRTTLFDDKMQLREKGMALAKELHENKAEAYDDLRSDAENPNSWGALTSGFAPGAYRGQAHLHSQRCCWTLKNGYDYLSKLHLTWAQQKDLPALDDVRYKYLYGNEFTEETADSAHVSRPEPTELPKIVAKRIHTNLAIKPKGDVFAIGAIGVPGQVLGH